MIAAQYRHQPDAVFVDTILDEFTVVPRRTRSELAEYWTRELSRIMDDRFDDGMPVLAYVFATNPGLRRRLSKVLFPT